jgi:hypothetical protein
MAEPSNAAVILELDETLEESETVTGVVVY